MGNVDGSVIIEVNATTDKFEKKIQDLESKYKSKEIDLELTEENLFNAEQDLKAMNAEVDKLDAKYYEINKKIKEQEAIIERINNTPRDYLTYEGRLASNSLNEQMNRARNEVTVLQRGQYKIVDEISKQNDLVINQEALVAKINAKYEKQKNDLAYINQQIANTELAQEQVNSTVEKTSTAHNKSLKTLTRIGLAVFGIRSAYMFVRQAMSHVLSGNEKLSNQMEGIKNSFYNAFAPIIEKIINGIKTLMAYINYLWKALFGKVLFAEKGTSNMKKNLAGGAKAAKEINKQLAGFDEANVLSSNKDSGSGGIGGGSGKYDLGLSDVPIPGWLKWIRDFIEEHPTISKIIFGLAAFTLFGGWKLAGGILGTISSLLGGGAGAGATGLIGILGTMLLIGGTILVLKVTYDKVKEAWKAYRALKEEREAADKVLDKSVETGKKFQKNMLDQLGLLDEEDKRRKAIIDGIKLDIETEEEQIRMRGENTRKGKEMQKQHQETIWNTMNQMRELYEQNKLTDEEQYEYYKMLNTYLDPELIEQQGYLMGNTEEGIKLKQTYDSLDKGFKTKYDVETQAAKDKFDAFVSKIKSTVSKPIEMKLTANIQGLTDKVKKALGIYHANGGIVNLPGRGVPVTHYAGEAGREGLVPMDNESQMALLGSEIAKRVTINLTNVTEMNGRTISKELKKISNESDFAFNR